MSSQKISRFEKLKSMREKLCESEKSRIEKVAQQAWLVEQVQELKKITDCDACTVEQVRSKISEIILNFDKSWSDK